MANQEKDVKRLRRADLLELLVEMSKENDALKEELAAARAELDERALKMEHVGTMAEASLALGDVFAAADAACVQYLEGVRLAYGEKDAEAQTDALAEAERIVAAAKEEARILVALAEENAEKAERKAHKRARKIIAAAKIEAGEIRDEARRRVRK